jgi:hypothetical protein
VQIETGRADIRMTEKLLDMIDAYAIFKQMGCKRMPQRMRCYILLNADLFLYTYEKYSELSGD